MTPIEKIKAIDSQGFMNVPEGLTLYDSILVGARIPYLKFKDGWFFNFAQAGASNSFPFLNVRNRNHHLAYNNQDTRDQLPYAMEIYSIGVDFWPPYVESQYQLTPPDGGSGGLIAYNNHSALWRNELPRHANIKFFVNQDEILNQQCCMAPSGMGPTGGGVAQGWTEGANSVNGSETASPILGVGSMGEAAITNRWPFPFPIAVPRRASISAVVSLSEYGRKLLASLPGPYAYVLQDMAGPGTFTKNTTFGITVSLTGKRLIQQRGRYHA